MESKGSAKGATREGKRAPREPTRVAGSPEGALMCHTPQTEREREEGRLREGGGGRERGREGGREREAETETDRDRQGDRQNW